MIEETGHKVRRLVANNQHTQALIEASKLLDVEYITLELEDILKAHLTLGYIAPDAEERRTELKNQLNWLGVRCYPNWTQNIKI